MGGVDPEVFILYLGTLIFPVLPQVSVVIPLAGQDGFDQDDCFTIT